MDDLKTELAIIARGLRAVARWFVEAFVDLDKPDLSRIDRATEN